MKILIVCSMFLTGCVSIEPNRTIPDPPTIQPPVENTIGGWMRKHDINIQIVRYHN